MSSKAQGGVAGRGIILVVAHSALATLRERVLVVGPDFRCLCVRRGPRPAVRWIADEKTAITDPCGTLKQIGGAALDITEHKLTEFEIKRVNAELDARVRARTRALVHATEAAKQADKAKGALLANMSHPEGQEAQRSHRRRGRARRHEDR